MSWRWGPLGPPGKKLRSTAKPIEHKVVEASGKEGRCERCRITIRKGETLHVRQIMGRPWIVHARCDVVGL
jgi:hypothetical protein